MQTYCPHCGAILSHDAQAAPAQATHMPDGTDYAASVTVRGVPMDMGDALQVVYGGRDPALVQRESRHPAPVPPAPAPRASQVLPAGTSWLVRQIKAGMRADIPTPSTKPKA